MYDLIRNYAINMGLKDIYDNRSAILGGHINELRTVAGLATKNEMAIFALREKICHSCALKKGNTCNPRKWINSTTLEVSDTAKEGFVRGCGCRLSAKQKSKGSICPASFWGNEF
ncbi:hypothetical protein ABW636_00370 [Aquimarina sp. 2201CG1-2-11]|uniref:hypothetical protein n=1 Tax=Aquimarina discodermiae TaxID=3231043 RepID=UPI003462609B